LHLNRISIGYSMGFNYTVDFKRLGGMALSNPGPAIGGAFNRDYDDGYNRVDSSGNSGDMTWYWGYQSPASVHDDSVELHSYSTPATARSMDHQDDPQHGFEISYSRELMRKERWRGGVAGVFNYTLLEIDDNSVLKHVAYRTNDLYSLNGVVPPIAPYAGTFEGPGPLLDSSLTAGDRSTTVLPRTATVYGNRKLESDIFTFRLGPYIELPLHRRVSLFLDGGLTLGVGASKFSFTERVEISDPVYGVDLISSRRSGSESQTDFLVGGFGGGRISYAVTEDISIFAGALYQTAGKSITRSKGKESVLNMGEGIIVSIGASYSF
jgi:hypothetical protein